MRVYFKDKDGLFSDYVDVAQSDIEYRTDGSVWINVEPQDVTPHLLECNCEIITKLKVNLNNIKVDEDVVYTLVDDVINKANSARDRLNNPSDGSDLLYAIDQYLEDILRIAKNAQDILEQ